MRGVGWRKVREGEDLQTKSGRQAGREKVWERGREGGR